MESNHISKAQKVISEHNLEPLLAEMLNSLVFERARNPEIFMIKYLASKLTNQERIKHGISVPDNLPVSKPIVKFPSEIKNEFLKKHLTKEMWNKVKYLKSKFMATVNDVICHENGVCIPDADVKIYNEFLTKI
jgi:hypothetical protein